MPKSNPKTDIHGIVETLIHIKPMPLITKKSLPLITNKPMPLLIKKPKQHFKTPRKGADIKQYD